MCVHHMSTVIQLSDYLVVNALERMCVGSVGNLLEVMTELFNKPESAEDQEHTDGILNVYFEYFSLLSRSVSFVLDNLMLQTFQTNRNPRVTPCSKWKSF